MGYGIRRSLGENALLVKQVSPQVSLTGRGRAHLLSNFPAKPLPPNSWNNSKWRATQRRRTRGPDFVGIPGKARSTWPAERPRHARQCRRSAELSEGAAAHVAHLCLSRGSSCTWPVRQVQWFCRIGVSIGFRQTSAIDRRSCVVA